MVRALMGLMVISVAGAVTACASDSDPGSSSVITETVTTSGAGGDASTDVTSESSSDAPDDGGGSSAGGNIEVPDVVGKDHQLAQDTMQAAGLYNLSEEDATGQGRMLLVDRNWTVVSQSPAAGSMVNEDETITLRSKKDGE
jgi:hypothetical protein